MVNGLHTDSGKPLPCGSLVPFMSQPIHTNLYHFPNQYEFEPFRFVHLHQQETEAQKGTRWSPNSFKINDSTGGSWSPYAFLSTASLLGDEAATSVCVVTWLTCN